MRTATELFVSAGRKPGQPLDDKKIALAEEQQLAVDQLPLWGGSSAIPADIEAAHCKESIVSKRLAGYVYRQGGTFQGGAFRSGWRPVWVRP